MRITFVCCLVLAIAGAALLGQSLPWRDAQELPAFEAVSVKSNVNAEIPIFRSRFQPGSYQATYASARDLIRVAYGLVVPEQVRGGPDWIDKDRFDIQAPAPGADTARMRLMLQRLLIERFKMSARSEKTELPVFELVLAREDGRLGGGLKPMGETCTAPAPPQAGTQALVEQMPCGQAILGSLFAARGISIARFAEMITGSRE